jgi:MFS transporter, DHA1 family, tetracycline resistance protein
MGLTIAAISFAGYGLAPVGWMIYAIIVAGSLSGVTGPSLQGLISRSVGANEQGGVQGSLASLTSVAGIIGPPIATGLFGYFIQPSAVIYLPGAAFFFSALLVFGALILAFRLFRRNTPQTVAVTTPIAVETETK